MKYSQEHVVKYYECDANSRLTLPMLLNIVIDTSEAQSALIERDSDYVKHLGITWVITEHDLHITRLPSTNEKIIVTTEAKEHNKYFCYRYFWLHDEEGNELVNMMTTFVLMDMTTRKMVSVPKELIEPYQSEKIKTIKRGEAFPTLTQKPERSLFDVHFSDIDTNQHVNNSRYLGWMVDSLSYDTLTMYQPRHATIRFIKETHCGEKIESLHDIIEQTTQDSSLTSVHGLNVDGNKCAEGIIKWRKQG
ncbi:acyl-[acyl-carrier-protein] thioesterase [Vagococcus xieshaowenii]|uniref:Acyl-[acyl-carrier-protein] thioesterase n=1 Tax=Vagococcus xieshaowenii TaxID=2562451 RepID=A0AAJ5EG48_9ENTE|nr:acyl-ACP thioesterase domain-containing protein [Vagococcus xieshaowenii]QCA29204.1 acyl-[acyl-carrier-protein] thioesterase [Vagococcus xieshaowenii]TFZ41937.1 acyl-[acyl-carrier-protein] thioesterase [Vagococcus xieshaowenii]